MKKNEQITTASSGDQMIKATQYWLNKTYKEFESTGRYTRISEDGYFGEGTLGALIKGLQIELGIQNTSSNFGSGTENAFKEHGNVERQDGKTDHIFGIIQGALWCKGYDCGHYGVRDGLTDNYYLDEEFDENVEKAIIKMQSDTGRKLTNGIVDLNTIKALLSMDYFVTYSTDAYSVNTRKIQQYLNYNYEDYIGLRPCDGVYGRKTNVGLIDAIQIEEGTPKSGVDGGIGPTTKRLLPSIPYKNVEKNYNGNYYSEDSIKKFIILLNAALGLNNFIGEDY